MLFWIKDPKTGKKSVTLTFFTIAFMIASFKLAMSGFQGYETFTGSDWAAVVGAAGGIYSVRKYCDHDKKDDDTKS